VTKNEIFARTLLHKVKERIKMGVVGKFYTANVLTVPKSAALNLPKLL